MLSTHAASNSFACSGHTSKCSFCHIQVHQPTGYLPATVGRREGCLHSALEVPGPGARKLLLPARFSAAEHVRKHSGFSALCRCMVPPLPPVPFLDCSQEQVANWSKRFGTSLGLKCQEMSGDTDAATDAAELNAADIICTTPEKFGELHPVQK